MSLGLIGPNLPCDVRGWSSLTDPLDARCQLFSQSSHVRLAKQFVMIKGNLVNLNPSFTANPPSHLRVVDVVERLPRTLEQSDWSAEALGDKILLPIDLHPFIPGLDPSGQ